MIEKKMSQYLAVFAIIVIITTVFAKFASSATNNIEFLQNYGWEVNKKVVEKVDIIIPDPFDKVYENYNKLQIEAGLDLENYKGRNAVRYTYIVNNYPRDVGEEVRANVICVDGIAVGGDIMTVSINGFMHSLIRPS